MKQILLGTCMAVLLAVGFAGCQSAGLKSDDAATRMKAVREIKEQDDLLDVARGKEYPNDVRLDALGRLSSQRNIWRVWCENGENKEVAAKALAALTDEDILVRVALLHSYEESAEEKAKRESAEQRKELAFGAAALAVNAGGAAAMGKAKGAGGKLAAVAGTKAANSTLAMAKAYADQKEPEPDMAVRTNEALVAVGKLKTLPAISAVTMNSTIECVQLDALRRLLYQTKDIKTLKEVACDGCLHGAKVTRYDNVSGSDALEQNKVIAIKMIQDPAALTNVMDRGHGEVRKYAFTRLVQLKGFDTAAATLCQYDAHDILRLGDKRDVPDAAAVKLVARFPEMRQCVALALGSKSDAIGKAAVGRLTDSKLLLQVVRGTQSMAVFKAAAAKLTDQHALEDIILAGGARSDCAISVLKDAAFVLELFKKAEKLDVRLALAKKLAPDDITADLCESEKEKTVKIVLLERASDEAKDELASRRQEKIKKAIEIAEKDGKEFLELIATKKSDQIDAKKVRSFFKGRLLVFRGAKMWNNHITFGNSRKACLVNASKEEPQSTGNRSSYTTQDFEIVFEPEHASIMEKYSMGDRVVAVGLMAPASDELWPKLDGDVFDKDDVLAKVTHVFDVFDPDGTSLNLMLEESDKSPTARYAESVGWEFPPRSAGQKDEATPGKDEVGKDSDEVKTEKTEPKKEEVKKAGSKKDDAEVKEASSDDDLDSVLSTENADQKKDKAAAEQTNAAVAEHGDGKQGTKTDSSNAVAKKDKAEVGTAENDKSEAKSEKGTATVLKTAAEEVAEKVADAIPKDKAEEKAEKVADAIPKDKAEEVAEKVADAIPKDKAEEKAEKVAGDVLNGLVNMFKDAKNLYWIIVAYLLVIGAAMTYVGRRYFKSLIFFVGAFTVYLPLHYFVSQEMALGIAAVSGLIMVFLYPIFVFIMGMVPVACVCLACGIQEPNTAISLVAGACGVIAFIFRKHIVIPVSAMSGSVMLSLGLVFLLKGMNPKLFPLIILAFMASGIFVQYKITARGLGKLGKKPDAQDKQ